MKTAIRILHLEDNPRDAQLIQNKLAVDGLACDIVQVDNKEQFEAALVEDSFDLILCDYNLPDYDGVSALKVARKRQPVTPVILISGMLGEEEAVKSLHLGATDYLLKQSLERLPSAVKRALEEAERHRERKRTEAALINSEIQLRLVWEKAGDGMRLTDAEGIVQRVNEAYCRLMRLPRSAVEGQPMSVPYAEAKQANALEKHRRRFRERGIPSHLETEITLRDGTRRQLELSNAFVIVPGQPEVVLSIFRDITERKQAEEALKQRAAELEMFHRLSVGRELQMIELKKEVNELARQAGRPPPYDISFLEKPENPEASH